MNSNTYHVFFTNLANSFKVDIVLCLKEKDKSVTEIAEELGVEQSKVSHALACLRQCNIVHVEQKGKQRIYSLNKKTILPMLELIENHSHNFCNKECNCRCN